MTYVIKGNARIGVRNDTQLEAFLSNGWKIEKKTTQLEKNTAPKEEEKKVETEWTKLEIKPLPKGFTKTKLTKYNREEMIELCESLGYRNVEDSKRLELLNLLIKDNNL